MENPDMQRSFAFTLVVLLLAGCASHKSKPAPQISLDGIEAQPLPEPPKPVEVVEIPKPLPLPGQLVPLPAIKAPAIETVQPSKRVMEANASARMEPTQEGFLNSIQVWPYSEGALYAIYAATGRVTDIALQEGEQVVSASAGDTVRWVIGDTTSGAGATQRVHLLVKPTRVDLKTNLVINTDRRTYYLELLSTPATWMASVSWDYPKDRLTLLQRSNRQADAGQSVADGIALDRLHFRYEISGDEVSWRPLRAFDDGAKVYIQFPAGIGQGELPPLFVIGSEGEVQLVNYRARPPYYIVDRLFGAAELRLGGKDERRVRIERTDHPGETKS
jgi:type IV secretion system protein VirB9